MNIALTNQKRKILLSRLEAKHQNEMMVLRKRLPEILKAAREEKWITERTAAAAIGVREVTVRAWESGSIPSLEMLAAYCKLIGVELSQVLAECGC